MTIMTMEPEELGESPKNKFANTFLNVVFYIFAVSYKAHRRISTTEARMSSLNILKVKKIKASGSEVESTFNKLKLQ
jgi:hypothetical protein